MVGLIWTIHTIHYALFPKVGEAYFPAYESEHINRIGKLLLLPWTLEGVTLLGILWLAFFGGYRKLRIPSLVGGFAMAVVLVISEIFGVHEHIADVARRFAKAGYFAIAPELFARQGDAGSYGEIAKLMAEVISKVPDEQVMGDLDACVAWAGGQGGDTQRVGITGFCWGGRTTWIYAAHNVRVKAGVAWYGPVARSYYPGDKTVTERAGEIKSAVLGLYGAADGGIPVDTLTQLETALKAAGNKACELVVYPDTPHAFHADYRPSYRAEAAKDGWARCQAWFKQHGV